MKLKENQEKKCHIPVSNPNNKNSGVHGAEQFNADTTRPHCRRYQKCNNLYSTSEPDKLVALNFVSRRQFFINIGKYPSKMQNVRNDLFLGNKIFKRRALFLIKDYFVEDLYFD